MKTATRNAYTAGVPMANQEARPVKRSGARTPNRASWDSRSMKQSELDDYQYAGEHPWRDEDVLRELYIERELSVTEIGEVLDCHEATPLPYLKEYGIKVDPYRSQRKEVSEDTLRDLYIEKGLTIDEAAEELGLGHQTVRGKLHGYGIPVDSDFNGEQAIIQNPETLERLYFDWGMSVREVGEWLRCSPTTVSAALERFGLEARGEGGSVHNIDVRDGDVLHELYVEKDLSQRGVAEELGVSPPSVRKNLKRHGFEIKPPVVHRRGERSPHWKGGTESYYGPFWRTRRQQAIERDNRQCKKCSMSLKEHLEEYGSELHVHHITRYADFDDDEAAHCLSNLVTVCYKCHGDIEGLPKDALADALGRERVADVEADAVAEEADR